jgi:hypothetical protein
MELAAGVLTMDIELIETDIDVETYGLVERGFTKDVIHYEGSKTEVLSFYLGMTGPMGEA